VDWKGTKAEMDTVSRKGHTVGPGVDSPTDTPVQGLKEFGSFHIGGRSVTLSGLAVTEGVITQGAPPRRIDPNGDFEVEQMYVQYMVPDPVRSRYPLLMWHGGGVTGVTWETKPDGSPGWMQYFFRSGHPVYVSDAVERGRASWARYPEICPGDPIYRSKVEAWETFRIGPPGSYHTDASRRVPYAGGRFPAGSFDQFAKQFVPRWNVNDAATLAAYMAEIQKVGPAVLMVHSQSGLFGFQAALAAPDMVRAIIAIEPGGAPLPGPALDKLKHIPMLVVWGDNVEQQPLWKRQQPASLAFAKDLNARGGKVTWLDLPGIGIIGNSHMVMMDDNSDRIASLIQDWMARNALMR
jgi:pimeloyl-ACP methyl ester carboxylesterase